MKINEAQIEAVAKAIHTFELEHGYVTREWRGINVETDYAAMAKAALTAAQVGEVAPGIQVLALASQKAIDATIERCAQVLEAAYAECDTLNLLHGAARLRKLKDAQ